MGAKEIYNLKVLVVDDDENILYFLKVALGKKVKELIFVKSALEGLRGL